LSAANIRVYYCNKTKNIKGVKSNVCWWGVKERLRAANNVLFDVGPWVCLSRDT